MKRLLQFFTLLTLALVGGAQTMLAETKTILSQDFESCNGVVPFENVFNGKNGYVAAWSLDASGSNTVLKGYSNVNGGRTGYVDLGVSNTSVKDNWTLSFDCAITPCTGSDQQMVVTGANTNVGAKVTGKAYLTLTNGGTENPTTYTVMVGNTTLENTITLEKGKIYSYQLVLSDANTSTASLNVIIKNGSSEVLNATQTVDPADIGFLRGFLDYNGKNAGTEIFDNILLTKEVEDGICENPSYVVTAPSGIARKFTLSCMTEGAVIYYSTTELAVGDEGWIEYTSEVTTDAKTVYAYAKTAGATSEVISFETGAGIEIQLNAPTVSIDFIKNGNVYTPVYSFASDQNDVTYKPTAILSYTINDGESVIGQSYIAKTTGKLVITASAEGYVSASTTIDISNNMFKRTFNYDFSSFTEHSATTVGNQTNVNSKGCQAYELAEDAVEGITINMNLLWALTADEAVGLYARVAKGSITYNGDFPEGSYAVFSNYGTPVVSSSATTSFALYGLALDMAVYVPVTTETITLPTSYTYSTFSSKYNLDFTDNADVEAYIAQVENDGVTVTLTKVEQVPAGEGVILKKTGDNTTAAVKVLASAEALSNNALVGVTEANTVSLETLAAAGNAYVLVSDEKFSKVSEGASGYISAGKAYLEYTPVAGASVNSLRISFGEPTAVADVEAKQEKGDNAIYNVQGIRVSKPTAPGMYIMNGKAFIVK